MKRLIVHTITMGDVDDPDLYVASPILKWQHSEVGNWVMEHSVETPSWERVIDTTTFGYKYNIIAYLNETDEVFFKLKYT